MNTPEPTNEITSAISAIPSAWKGHEGFAQWVVSTIRPSVIVELGVDYGFSAINMALPGIGIVYAIDAFAGDEHTGLRNAETQCRANIAASGVCNLKLCVGSFKEWVDQVPEIDILHIDGRHNYSDVREDFERYAARVRPGGVILLHDTRSFPNDVGRLYGEIQWPKFEFTHSFGLGVVTKP